MSTVEDLSANEERAYELVTSRDGILQSELWKELDVTSRTGSRLATSLEEKALLRREQITSHGHRTYLLEPTHGHTVPIETKSEPREGFQNEGDDELDKLEKETMALISDRGGISQSELWKELTVSSRTGSRLATSLEEQGLIRREEATYNGRQTYLLLPATKELDFSLLMAGNMLSPLIGADEERDPLSSDAFTQWIVQLTQEDR